MLDLIRDAPVGQMIRLITRNRLLQYPEEQPDFKCPAYYADPSAPLQDASDSRHSLSLTHRTADDGYIDPEKELENGVRGQDLVALHLTRTITDASQLTLERPPTNKSHASHTASRIALERSATQADLEQAFEDAIQEQVSKPVIPEKLEDGTILVDWYRTDDPANPQNWSAVKKGVVTGLICLFTTAVYIGAAIYAPSEPGVMEQFGVSATAASLGLALYICAYGVGPLIFSPISEIPSIGRNPPYILTFALFVILSIPAALVNNFGGLLVLRILQGFFGSPILATGGASLQDMFSLMTVPYILCCWASAAVFGPAVGPIISGFSVPAENWHWSLWEILWLAGPIWILLFLFLPETYSESILLRRAQRLRKLTGNQNLKSQSEINQAQLRFSDIVQQALVRPIKLTVLDPSIAYANLYIALCYGILYSFFEVSVVKSMRSHYQY